MGLRVSSGRNTPQFYFLDDIPEELLQRIGETARHTCKAGPRSFNDRFNDHIRLSNDLHSCNVRLYTMLNWITDSGWELKNSFGDDKREVYVFVHTSAP